MTLNVIDRARGQQEILSRGNVLATKMHKRYTPSREATGTLPDRWVSNPLHLSCGNWTTESLRRELLCQKTVGSPRALANNVSSVLLPCYVGLIRPEQQ
jgi:hypothetical protein